MVSSITPQLIRVVAYKQPLFNDAKTVTGGIRLSQIQQAISL